ncbi:hypothetical protein V8D89_004551 [Ganoderma adspersum]
MIVDKSTGYEHERDFAPPPEPPPSYDSARHQSSYPTIQEPIPYPNQQPSARYPAPQGPPYAAPQGPPYSAPQGPPYPTQPSASSSAPKATPPLHRNFAPFETITVPTLHYRLADGFSPDLPPSHEQPHPFASHDVTQEDWLAFLGDMRRITQNTSEERLRETFGAESSSFISAGGRGGLARGLLGALAEGVTKSMSGGSSKAAQEPISLLIAEWNRVRLPPPPPLPSLDPASLLSYPSTELLEPPQYRNAPSDPYAYPNAYDGRGLGLRSSRSSRRDDRRSQKQAKRAERSAFGTELIADVHHMLGAKESSAAYRAAADEERYGGQPVWCLVLRYVGPAPGPSYAGGGSGWATRP